MAEKEEREPGLLSYDHSPGMTGDNRYTRVKKPKEEKDGRRLDSAGDAILSYSNSPELSGGVPKERGTTLHYRDGKVRELPDHRSINQVVDSGIGIDLKKLILDGQTIEINQALNRDFRDSSFRNAQLIGDFSGGSFRGADLRGCKLSGRFQNCDLTGALLDENTYLEADFSNADITDIVGWDSAKKDGIIVENIRGIEMEELEKSLQKPEEKLEKEEEELEKLEQELKELEAEEEEAEEEE